MTRNIKFLPFLLLSIYFVFVKINILSSFSSKLATILLIAGLNVFLYVKYVKNNQNKIKKNNLFLLLFFSLISTALLLYNLFKFKLI